MINNKPPNSDYTIHFSLPGKASPGQTLGLDSDLVLVSVFVFCVQDSSLSTHNLNCLTASEDCEIFLCGGQLELCPLLLSLPVVRGHTPVA